MRIKKLETSMICLFMIFSALMISNATVTAAEPITFRGYVYVDTNITAPDQVIGSIGTNNYVATIPGSPEGYYSLDFEGNLGDTIRFDVVISGTTFTNVVVHTITNAINKNFNLTIDTGDNYPPNPPSNPTPSDGASNQDTGVNLAWSGGDPNPLDTVTYDVYFGTSNPPTTLVSQNQSSTTYDPGTLGYQTSYHWQIISWDNHGSTTTGPVWSFSTKEKSSGGGGGGGGGGTPATNQPPTAVATVDVAETTVNTPLSFDGSASSDPDGTIVSFLWDFDDGQTSTQMNPTHQYTSHGTYTVMLTVTDDEGATNSDSLEIFVVQLNNPPSLLTITGQTEGTQDTSYSYSISAIDPDNDTIQYAIDWGDGETFTTQFLPSGNETQETHIWTQAGKYTIKVTATDNETPSETLSLDIMIDAHDLYYQNTYLGYIIDQDADGTYDSFQNKESTISPTTVSEEQENQYLIDVDGDDSWDYRYNSETDEVSIYIEPTPEEDNTMLIVLVVIIILFLIILVILYYRHQKQEEERRKKEQKRKSQQKKKETSERKSSSKKKSTKK